MRRVRNVVSNCEASDLGPLDSATMEIVRKHAWEKNFYS
jgi:hypothetical protein